MLLILLYEIYKSKELSYSFLKKNTKLCVITFDGWRQMFVLKF